MVLKKLKSLLGSSPNAPRARTGVATRETLLNPDAPFCAIGDAHGRLDLLAPLYDRIRATYGADIPVVFLGDFVDRGPESAGVLRMVRDLNMARPDVDIALTGNHEKMMIEFIDDPAGKGARWLTFGGIETLHSFGISQNSIRYDAEDALEAADALEDALPDGMLDWLRTLPATWVSGNMHCVHAGMDPDIAADAQKTKVMINGLPNFLTRARQDDVTVVHGHTVMQEAAVWDGRVSLDTGAYLNGRLTAAYIEKGTCTFLT